MGLGRAIAIVEISVSSNRCGAEVQARSSLCYSSIFMILYIDDSVYRLLDITTTAM